MGFNWTKYILFVGACALCFACENGSSQSVPATGESQDAGAAVVDQGQTAVVDATPTVMNPDVSIPRHDAGSDVGAVDGSTLDAEVMVDAHAPVDAGLLVDAQRVMDSQAPTWPQGAVLFVEHRQQREALLAWSHALDDQGVTLYRIYQDGQEVGRSVGNQASYLAVGLLEGVTYTYGVVAEDAAGNRSEMLSLRFMTSDQSAPVWGENAVVRAVNVGETMATITWPAARDNVSVARYRILLDDRIVLETAELTADLTALSAMRTYRVEVVAMDGARNVSVANPTVEFTTVDTTGPEFAAGAALVLHEATPRQVRVTWQAAIDNVGVSGYEVSLDGAQLGRVDGQTRSYTVQGLRAGTRVTVAVRAFDATGNMSAAGPSATFDTGDDTSPTWPENPSIRASELTPSSLTLAWTAAVDDVGVSAYTITQNGQVLGESAVAQFAVGQLRPWTDYTFTVRARDAVGNAGAGVLSVNVRTPDDSVPFWQVGESLAAIDVTPSSLTLSWPQATDDVSIVTYEVTQDGVVLGTVDGATTEFDVAQLAPWTEYTFAVTAIDQAGNRASTQLDLTRRTPDEVLPVWPDGRLNTSDITPSGFTLGWTAASDDVGVTAYVVHQDGVELARLGSDRLSLPVNGLMPWTEYTFTVRAEDAAGNSTAQALSVVQRTPDAVAPAFPEDAAISVADLTSTSAMVRWPAAVDDVAVVRYEVTVDGGPQSSIDGQVTETQLSQLRAMRAYLVAVTAYDAVGNPSAELTTTINTPDGGPPTWGNARLTGTAGISEVQLSWEPAVDDVAVTAYRVYQDEDPIYEGAERAFLVASLTPETAYTFRVEAGDAAGHWSANGPTTSVTTAKAYDPGFKRLTKVQYTRTVTDMYGRLAAHLIARREALGMDLADWQRGHHHAESTYQSFMIGGHNFQRIYRLLYPSDTVIPGPESPRGGFSRLDDVVYNQHVSSWVGLAMFMAQPYKEFIGGWIMVAEPCRHEFRTGLRAAPSEIEAYDQCATEVIDFIGPLALRRPMGPEERAAFLVIYREGRDAARGQGLYGADPANVGLAKALAVIGLQPEVSYRIELGDEHGRLTAYELASRLSYHFWNTLPDDELFAAASDGSLLTDDGYTAQVNRLFDDPRADRAVSEFYAEYFRVDSIHDVESQDSPGGAATLSYHRGPENDPVLVPGGKPSVDWQGNDARGFISYIQESMQSEFINLGRYFTRIAPGSFEEMFRSNLHFMECRNLENTDPNGCLGAGPYAQVVYGVDGNCDDYADCVNRGYVNVDIGWDGVSPPIEIPDPTRVGLITRMGFLAHDTLQARPIRRGLLIREMLLCDPIPPPENCDVVQPPALAGVCTDANGVETNECTGDSQCQPGETCVGWDRSVTMTVREKVETLTEEPGTTCAQCHSTLINGFGHALSHFSSLGQYWETEHMFTTQRDQNDNFWYFSRPQDQWPDIDTTGQTIMNGRLVQFDGPQAVADILVDSGQMEWCWSREYFRYAMGRHEWESDVDTIETMAQNLRDGGTLRDAFKAIVHTPQFKSLYKAPNLANEGGQ